MIILILKNINPILKSLIVFSYQSIDHDLVFAITEALIRYDTIDPDDTMFDNTWKVTPAEVLKILKSVISSIGLKHKYCFHIIRNFQTYVLQHLTFN